MNFLGDFPEDFATVTIPVTTHDAGGSLVAPSSAFEAADFRIYKDGADTQKATTNGITIASPFDSLTGVHMLVIDTSVNTGDTGFWTAGSVYDVLLVPDETVDGKSVGRWVGRFTLGMVPTAAAIRAAVGLASANLDTQLDALPTNAELATALAAADDAVLAAIAALSIPTANANADALLDRANAIEAGLTLREAMRLLSAVLAGKASGGQTGTETFRNAVADTKDRLVSTTDAQGNRSAITYDVT